MYLSDPKWGDVPAWITAVATAGALIAAIAAAIATFQLLKREAQRDKDNDDERRARQALQISAWYGSEQRTHGTYLRNASSSPVYDVIIEYYDPVRDSGLSFRGFDNEHTVLPPLDDPLFVRVADTIASNLNEYTLPGLVISLSFRDSAGRRWRRDTKGQLSEISDPIPYGREAAPPPDQSGATP